MLFVGATLSSIYKLKLILKPAILLKFSHFQLYSMWSLVRTSPRCPWSASFPKMIKYFVKDKSTLNNERYRDLLISILSYDEVSAFLLRVKTRNQSLLTGRVICLSWSLDFCGTVNTWSCLLSLRITKMQRDDLPFCRTGFQITLFLLLEAYCCRRWISPHQFAPQVHF